MLTGNGVDANQIITPVLENNIETNQSTDKQLPLTTEEIVIDYFREDPILAKVAFCESTFRHYLADGSVLKGEVDNRDTGVMQINTYYHGDTAKRLGLDLHKLEDNMAYAKNLYERQGLEPWSASSNCWSKYMHLAQK